MQKRFARSLETLPVVIDTVSRFCRTNGASGDSVFALSFAVEEIFTNLVKYNPDGPPEVSLSLAASPKDLTITVEDEQETDFDPTAAPDPPFGEELAKRKPGGLGLYLVRKIVRHVEYARKDTHSTITLSHPLE